MIVNSAAELVKELHDGEACPVCGSREHPLPAKATDEIEKLEAVINAAENQLREVRNWEGQLLKLWHDWSNNDSLVGKSRDLVAKTEKDLQVILTEFEKARGTFDRDQLRIRKQELTDFERRLHSIDQKQEAMQKTQAELNEKLQKLNNSFQNDKIKDASTQADLTNFQSQLKDIAEEFNQITGGKDLDDLIRDMIQTHEKLQKAVENTKRKEAETRAAKEQIAREIAALEASLKANRDEFTDVDRRLAKGLSEAGYTEVGQAESALLSAVDRQAIRSDRLEL